MGEKEVEMPPAAADGPDLDLSTLQLSSGRLFDEVPCWISIQDRDFRIVKASPKLTADFGNHQGEKCYSVYKGRAAPCTECVVAHTFEDGKEHSSQDTLFDKRGVPHDLLVKTRPLRNQAGEIVAVMKLFVDISAETALANRLHD